MFFALDFMDFADKQEPLKKGIVTVTMGEFIDAPSRKSVYVPLKLNKLDLRDPFDFPLLAGDSQPQFFMSTSMDLKQDEQSVSAEKFSADIEKGNIEAYNEMMGFEMRFALTGFIDVHARTQYTVWGLVADVGGFYSGLLLLSSIFMGKYSSAAFDVSYINGSYVDRGFNGNDFYQPRSPKKPHPNNSPAKAAVQDENPPTENLFPNLDRGASGRVNAETIFEPPTDVGAYSRVIKSAQRLKTSLCEYMCLTCNTNRKDRRLKEAAIKHYEKHTDVRNVIKTAIDLRILLRKTLTPAQQQLFRFQRERLPSAGPGSGYSSDSSSDSNDDNEPWNKIKIAKFIKVLQDFEPSDNLDLKLLKGILVRPRMRTKQMQKKASQVVKERPAKVRQSREYTPSTQVVPVIESLVNLSERQALKQSPR